MRAILLTFLILMFGQMPGKAAASLPIDVPALTPSTAASTTFKISEINANLFSVLYDFFNTTTKHLIEGATSLKEFIQLGEWVMLSLKSPILRNQFIFYNFQLIITLLVAFALAYGLSYWLRPKINALLRCRQFPPFQKFQKLVAAVALTLLTPLVFGFVFYTISRFLSGDKGLYIAVVRIISSGIVTIWSLLGIASLFLKPASLDHRHIPLSREALWGAYIWLRRIASVALFGFFTLEIGALIDLPVIGEKFLLQGTSFIIAILTILMLGGLQKDMKKWIATQYKTSRASVVKKAMLPYLNYGYSAVVVFIVISYVEWTTHSYDPFLSLVWKGLFTLALFPIIRLFSLFLRKIRIFYFYKPYGYLSFLSVKAFSGRQIDFITLILLNIVGFLLVAEMWGFHLSTFLFSHLGQILLERTFSIFVIILVAFSLTRMGNTLLTRYLKTAKDSQTDEQKQKMARFKTIYSVSRNALRIAVWTPAALLIAVELGVNVIPLLTTVGIFSVGLSFGVQSLVKDFVTGFFMLLEDAFAVGDLVLINNQMGRIESLTVRIVRLRATDGSLYLFPYGSITSLCNQNRDFSAAVIFFRVGFEADLAQVFEILDKISKDLKREPYTRNLVLGSIEIDGVNEVSDNAIEIRVVIKTKPGEYFKVKYAFNRLLKHYLGAEKIPPATPREICYNYGLEK